MEMNAQTVNLFGKITVGLGWLVLKEEMGKTPEPISSLG